MATDAQNVATIISNLLSILATESANPKPSYSIDGQSVDWNGYRANLLKQISDLQQMRAALDGAYEIIEVAEG